jgi:hypothetical protein
MEDRFRIHQIVAAAECISGSVYVRSAATNLTGVAIDRLSRNTLWAWPSRTGSFGIPCLDVHEGREREFGGVYTSTADRFTRAIISSATFTTLPSDAPSFLF